MTARPVSSGTTVSDASTSTKGVTKLATAPASASNPIAVGDNDIRLPPTGGPGYAYRATSNGAITWNSLSLGTNLYAPAPSGDTTGATDTAAIQSLIDQVYTAGGGAVNLQPTNNTVAPYYITQLKIRSFVELQGVSRWGTVLRAPIGQASGTHMIILYDDLTWGFALRRFTLDGQNGKGPVYGATTTPAQANAFDGLYFDITTSVNHFDPYGADSAGVIEDINVVQTGYAGITIKRAMSELRFRGVYVISCYAVGWRSDYADCFFDSCTAGANGVIGWDCSGAVNHYSNCKSWWNGWRNVGISGGGPGDWVLRGHGETFVNISGGDSYGAGIELTSAADSNQVQGLVSGATTSNVKLNGGVNNYVNLVTHDQINNAVPVHVLDHASTSTGNTILIQGDAGQSGTAVTGGSLIGNDVTMLQQATTKSVSYAATITPDPYAGSKIVVGTLTGGITINNPSRGHVGCPLEFTLTQDGTGGRTVTWGANYKTTAAIGTTASSVTKIAFDYDGTNWRERWRSVT